MKKFLVSFIIPILTFAVGVFVYRNSTPKVSLETITEHTWFYDGMNVEIENYLQAVSYDDESLFLGDFSNRTGSAFYIHPSDSKINLDNLQNQLKENFTETKFKRVKVLVKGKVKDNCTTFSENGTISFGCCFGRSVTIKAQEVKQIAPTEDYTRPR